GGDFFIGKTALYVEKNSPRNNPDPAPGCGNHDRPHHHTRNNHNHYSSFYVLPRSGLASA
ncbi:hypothetical protein OEZ66_41495, partial [Escherichia coli]|nr:hypothetical protein [Escherichia coli]